MTSAPPIDLAAGLAFVLWTARSRGVRVDRNQRLVFLPGTLVPLIRNTVIVAVNYGLSVAAALRPDARAELAFWDLALSGASAGYFLGWLVRFVGIYRGTLSIDLTPTTVLDLLPRAERWCPNIFNLPDCSG